MTSFKLFAVALISSSMLFGFAASAQSDDNQTSLGDLARSLRKKKAAPTETVIDNENFSQVVEEVHKNKQATGGAEYSFEKDAKNFQISSPDVTCSLAFSAQATALISDSYLSRDLPGGELAKLDGPALIDGNDLQVSVYNGSAWNLKEITVGLTIVRRSDDRASFYGSARLIPAAGSESTGSAQKRSDVTMLYHLKGAAAPHATTVFREPLGASIPPGQEWHWAIISAKGTPPQSK